MTKQQDTSTPASAEKSESGQSGLLKASGITGSMTMVSRVLGLVRDVAIARIFGTSDAADAFFLANKIPNFMRRLFAEGAFNQAFVPVLSEYRSQRSLLDVQQLINAVSASLGGFLLLLTAIVVIAAPLIAVPLAYGFTDEPAKFELFVQMLRITFPYLLLISMTALCSAILNSYGRFAVPALTPALLNVSLIACAFLLAPYMAVPEMALAWGVLLAGVAQLFFQLPFLVRMQLLPKPVFVKQHEGVKRIKELMVPALFGVSISQINLLLDTFIASLLISGSVSWLYYSDRLMELPLGTFGVAIAIVVLPSLSRKHAESSMSAFAETLDWALRMVFLIAIPATLGLVLIAEPLLITLFQGGAFEVADVTSSAGSLRAYAFGLLAFMAIKVLAPGYYSRQDTKTPVRIGIIAMTTNMILNIVFYLNDMAHVGLALATSIAAFANAGLLLRGLVKEAVFHWQSGWGKFLLQLTVANTAMAAFLVFMAGPWQEWVQWSVMDQVLQLCILVLGSILVYVSSLGLLGMRWRHIYR